MLDSPVPFLAYQDTVELVASAGCFRGVEVAQPGGGTAEYGETVESHGYKWGSHVVEIVGLEMGATFGSVLRIRKLLPGQCCQNQATSQMDLPFDQASMNPVGYLSLVIARCGFAGGRLVSRTVQPSCAAASAETWLIVARHFVIHEVTVTPELMDVRHSCLSAAGQWLTRESRAAASTVVGDIRYYDLAENLSVYYIQPHDGLV